MRKARTAELTRRLRRNGSATKRVNANGEPLVEILGKSFEPFGQGQMMVLKLACGHVVKHLWRRDLKVGGRTGCEECKPCPTYETSGHRG